MIPPLRSPLDDPDPGRVAGAGIPASAPLPPAREALQRGLAENDALIRSTDLDNGGAIVAARTALFTSAIAEWAAGLAGELDFDRPFAVVALGGTGRQEVTPCSDLDIAFLFEDPIPELPAPEQGAPVDPASLDPLAAFLLRVQRQCLHGNAFRDRFGFRLTALPYGLPDVPQLREKDLNSFLDLAPIHDPHGLAPAFRRRIRETYDPFEHFLHVRGLWRRQWERAGAMAERIDQFDLKNDALRLFLGGIWTLGGKEFIHSHEVYDRLEVEDPRYLEAYRFLLRLRCWIHLRRPPGGVPTALGSHAEDVMTYPDFAGFGDWLGPGADDRERLAFADEVRQRLLTARRRIAAFARGVIESELRPGRRISPGHPVALGAGGLYHAEPETCITNNDRSRAALSLLRMAQRYELPIDPSELLTTFEHAGDWLEPVPELGALFRETRGSLAATFDFLSQIPGAEDRLFPGYARFESTLDERVRTEQKTLRGALEREKMRALEADQREGQRLIADAYDPGRLTDAGYDIRVEIEAAQLSEEQLAAVRLAIKTKRLPLTPDDLAARQDPERPLSDRFSSGFSGVPLDEYHSRFFSGAGFAPATLELTRFLIANRRTLQEIADVGIIDDPAVADLLSRCGGDLDRLRALYVFTHVDRHAWKSPATHPDRFFNIRELYAKARMPDNRRFDPRRLLREAGCHDAESQGILLDFGREFFEGIYRHYALRFAPHLLRLAGASDGPAKPKALTIHSGPAQILGVAARDDRGLAASISGALWKHGRGLRQAHLFSASHHGLALDFFHLAPPRTDGEESAPSLQDLARLVETAILERQNRSESDEAALPRVARRVTLSEWRPGLYRLRAETDGDIGALVYLLCLKAYRQLDADIHGLTARTGRSGSQVSVFLNLPRSLAIEDARQLVENW